PATSAVGMIYRLYHTLYNVADSLESKGFLFACASNRGRDHRHFGRDRDSEVRQHEGKGLSRVDEVGPPEPRDGRRGLLCRFGEVHDEPGYGVLDDQRRDRKSVV